MGQREKGIVKLYLKGKSANWVASQYGISLWSVYHILKKNKIARRTSAATNKIFFRSQPTSFRPVTKLSICQKLLQQAGLLLYLGEGSKRTSHTVDLANSDPKILLLFLKMLREVYGINESRLRVLLYCHSNRSPAELITYWSTTFRIPKEQFTKPYIKAGYKEGNSDKMKNGLVHIRYSDTRLWERIMQDMDRLVDKLLG